MLGQYRFERTRETGNVDFGALTIYEPGLVPLCTRFSWDYTSLTLGLSTILNLPVRAAIL